MKDILEKAQAETDERVETYTGVTRTSKHAKGHTRPKNWRANKRRKRKRAKQARRR